MKSNKAELPVRGRPVDTGLSGRILATTLELLARGGGGFKALRLDDVAAQCGTSKQALYRRWPDKSHLAAAAIVDALAHANPRIPDWESAIGALIAVLENAIDAWQSTPLGGALRVLIGETGDPALAACLHRADSERRQVLRAVLRLAVERKEIRPLENLELAIDQLLGGAWMRYLTAGRVPRGYARRAVQAWLDGALADR